ncbi:MAG: 4Fe-4S binding protein [Firmicutes bacterium]|jgi:epoxyqueuosine reductase QueG|nr:4Fe-4S binding protein [Bacillota bacterium]
MKSELIDFLKSLGASKIRIGNLEGHLPEHLKDLKTGISFCIRLQDRVIEEIEDKPTFTYFHHYRSVNSLIDHISLRGAMFLQDKGYDCYPIPASQSIRDKSYYYSGIFQHRTAATRSGLGWIGKNNCLVTKEFGPRIRLGTILTDAVFEYDEPINESLCGDCMVCVDSCPALALKGENWKVGMDRELITDPKACSDHMSHHYKDIGRGVVCGICINRCPFGKKKKKINT